MNIFEKLFVKLGDLLMTPKGFMACTAFVGLVIGPIGLYLSIKVLGFATPTAWLSVPVMVIVGMVSLIRLVHLHIKDRSGRAE